MSNETNAPAKPAVAEKQNSGCLLFLLLMLGFGVLTGVGIYLLTLLNHPAAG